jgi:hypothetical protein
VKTNTLQNSIEKMNTCGVNCYEEAKVTIEAFEI